MRETAKPSVGDRYPPRSRAVREARLRRRLGVALLVSAAVHAALFALPAIQVPLLPDSVVTRGVVTHRPGLAAERPIEVVHVVEIRPPGPASIDAGGQGGSPSGRASIPTASHAAGAATRIAPSGAAGPVSAPVRSSLRLALTAIADTASEAPSLGPPKRGVYERPHGAAPEGAGRGLGGRGGAGRGLGLGSGGVTVIGPGGDCISPGVVPRTGSLGLPGLARPGGARRPGVGRSGRP